MTLHIRYDHQCPSCDALYIPYDEAVPCPRCGLVEQERFDFIPQAASSARANFRQFGVGMYTPMAWHFSTFGDHILYTVFQILDAHQGDENQRPFPEVARDAVDTIHWGENAYLREHIYHLACRVYDQLQQPTEAGGERPVVPVSSTRSTQHQRFQK